MDVGPEVTARLHSRTRRSWALCCGGPGCGAAVAELSEEGYYWTPGFRLGPEGVWQLQGRVLRQWEKFKRAGQLWRDFIPRGRTAWSPRHTGNLQGYPVPRTLVRFRCPVCPVKINTFDLSPAPGPETLRGSVRRLAGMPGR